MMNMMVFAMMIAMMLMLWTAVPWVDVTNYCHESDICYRSQLTLLANATYTASYMGALYCL